MDMTLVVSFEVYIARQLWNVVVSYLNVDIYRLK